MSNNLGINPYPASLKYSGHFRLQYPVTQVGGRVAKRIGTIRSSKNPAIFHSKLSKTLRSSGSKMPSVLLGATPPSVRLEDAKCIPWRGAKRIPYSSTAVRVAKYSKSEPHLNGLEGPFVPDSFRLCAAVNQAKMRPPQTLCTFKVGGAERSLRSINPRFPQAIHNPRCLGTRVTSSFFF